MVYKKMTKEERQKYAIEQADKLSSDILKMAESFRTSPADLVEYLKFQSKFHNYSARNMMLIKKQNDGASYLASFKDFKDMGYSVNKGEKGYKIFVPVTKKYYKKDGTDKWLPYSSAPENEKAAINQQVGYELDVKHVYSIGTVFDVSQTNCPDEDLPKLLNQGYKDASQSLLIEGMKEYMDMSNISYDSYSITSVTERGFYKPSENLISINERLKDTQILSTLTHEIGHHWMYQHTDETHKSESHREFEADALSIMMLNNFDVEIPETRLSHLNSHYNNFLQEQTFKKEEERIDILDVLQEVKASYNSSIPTLTQVMNRYIDISKDIDNAIENNYISRYELRLLDIEANQKLSEPLPINMSLNQANKEFEKLLDRYTEEDRSTSTVTEIKFYIIDKQDKNSIFIGNIDLESPLTMTEQIDEQILELNTLNNSKDEKESLLNVSKNIKKELYQEQLHDYVHNYDLLEENQRHDIAKKIETTKKMLEYTEKEHSNSKQKDETMYVKQEVTREI